MVIIQEQISRNGMLSVNTLNNVRRLYKANNQTLRGFDGPQLVIWAKMETKSFPIVFPNEKTRDAAYEVLTDADSVVLDYHEYFTFEVITQIRVNDLVSMKLNNHLRICIEKIIERDAIDYAALLERDAFKGLNMRTIMKLMQRGRVDLNPTDRQLSLWAKTLHTPQDILRIGITPLQFFKALSKNETTSNFSSRDHILM